MISKFDINPQSEDSLAAEMYEAQAAYEAEQAEYEWTDEAIEWEEGFRSDELYDYDEVDLYGAEWENYAVREWD